MYSTVRSFARSLALRIPPLRRLYDSAVRHREENAQLTQTLDRLRASNAAIGSQLVEQSTALAAAELAAQSDVSAVVSGREAILRAERDRARAALTSLRQDAAQARTALHQAQSEKATADAALAQAVGAISERDVLRERLAAADAKLEQFEARMAEHAMAEARVALLIAELEGEGATSATKALRAELALVKHERNLITARGLPGSGPDMQVVGARLNELEEAVRAAYEAVGAANTERDEARNELDKVNQELRVTSAENMARLLGKLSLVEYAMRDGGGAGAAASGASKGLYLDLLESSLTGALDRDVSQSPWTDRVYDAEKRLLGRDWPERALTMIGGVRMRNLRRIVERIIADDVPGDLIETGVWRGGACIYMRGILAAYGDAERSVWVADSFRGLPAPSPDLYPADAGDTHSSYDPLAISLEDVRANFARYGLLDERVQFLLGWFKDTLPAAPIKGLSLLRLDGDMYESTIQALDALYAKLAPSGFVIVDDFELPGCRRAVEDFRARHQIDDRIEEIDGASVFWRKAAGPSADVVSMAGKRRSEQPN